MVDNIPTNDVNTNVHALIKDKQEPLRTILRKASDYLQDNQRTGYHIQSYNKRRRYAPLRKNDIFENLVQLYARVFKSQWNHFRRLSDSFPVHGAIDREVYMARVYISHWFIDLYVSTYDACYRISSIAFNDRFPTPLDQQSRFYDAYLVKLNTLMRPTNIKGVPEDSLYIPTIHHPVDYQNQDNPFDIEDFVYNRDYFRAILSIMCEKRANFIMHELTNETVGRATWLLDWHDDKMCAWFPLEGNYTTEDVTIAYILGVACTPKLGPVDVDDYQRFQNDIVPENLNIEAFNRVNERAFYGAFEVRTLDRSTLRYQIPQETTATSGTSQQPRTRTGDTRNEPVVTITTRAQAPIPEAQLHFEVIRIMDWIYHCRVNKSISEVSRENALQQLVRADISSFSH